MDDSNTLPNEEGHEDVEVVTPFYWQFFGQFFGTTHEVIARYTHCALCGANLHFVHITDFSKNLTQETAKCPECGVRARRLMHNLQ